MFFDSIDLPKISNSINKNLVKQCCKTMWFQKIWKILLLIYLIVCISNPNIQFISMIFRYTNNDDWPLHEQMDFAEEHTMTDIDKAIELFDNILEKHPKSPRGLYVRARIMENRLLASNLTKNSEEYQNQLNYIFDVFASLMDRYEDIGGSVEDYDIMPVLYVSYS